MPAQMRALPSGVVSLLFTDIEGSTRLLQELGPGYPDALAAHRRVLREAFDRNAGVEVDTQGDSFLVAFSRASDAVSAATEAQRSLASGPVRVRMAVHTGEPSTTGEGYAGIDVHRGARIAASGHGGQILVSESTRALIDVPLRDLGRHRLKDLSAPERIFQVEPPGLRLDFPPLRTLEAGRSNLPATTTSFLGRDAELQAIDECLDGSASRLITLVGPGGAGKSRLALEAARRRLAMYQHGVFHVPLVAVDDPDVITLTIAGAIGLTIDTMWGLDRPRDDQLVGYLAERSLLLLLDNFEHLLEGAEVVRKIGENAPGVHVLVTSRERLGLQGERVIDLAGLQDAGEQLFLERARQGNASFSVAEADRKDVARICALVEYMPLGIELAAAWATMLPPAELARELEKSLDVLTAAHRDVPERHRSLRAVFDGSWRLMSEQERAAFSRLSVFRGDFSREAARAIADVDLTLLAALVDKSLVKRAEIGRFEIHELLRQYAAEALLVEAAHADAVRERHARWFAELLHARVDRLRGADMLDARDEIRLDIGNLRGAAEWIAARWPTPDARQAAADLDAFYMTHSWSEGADLFGRLADLRSDQQDAGWLRIRGVHASRLSALNRSAASDAVALETIPRLADGGGDAWDLGQCLWARGTSALDRDDYQSGVALLLEARQAALESADPHLIVWVDVWLGWGEIFTSDLESAREHFDEALTIARSTGSEMLLGYSFSKLGILADELGDHVTGLRYHLQSHERFERNGDRPGLGYAMTRASLSSYFLRDYESALRYAGAGLDAFSEINHPWGIAASQCRIGFAAIGGGDFEKARTTLFEAVERSTAIGMRAMVVHAITGLAVLAGREGAASTAVAVLDAATHIAGLPGLYRMLAEHEIADIAETLTAEELAAARERAEVEGFDRLVEPLLVAHGA
jgi:predicted ATPase/class 3 adenylate cyclase